MQARSLLFSAALLVSGLLPTSLRAAEPLRLSVVRSRGAEDCPDSEALLQKIQALLRPGAAQNDVRVDAEFVHQQALYSVTLRISGDHAGLRTLSDPGPTCNGLADATALTLAMLLDPTMSAPLPPPAPTTTAPPPAPTPPPAPREPAPSTELFAGALVTTGLTASPAPGWRVGGGLAGPSWNAGLGVLWLPGRPFELAPGTVDVSLLAALLRGCWQRPAGPLELGLCGQAGVGRYQAEARGYSRNLSPGELWIGGGASGLARGVIHGAWSWEGELGWVSSWRRRAFVIEGVGKAFDPPAWGGLLAGVALVWRP